jgi:hypothetical protein
MNQTRARSLLSVVIVAFVVAGAARAAVAQNTASAFAPAPQPGGGFGAQGQFAISGAAVEVNSASASFRTGGSGSIFIHPAADYFIVNAVSVGGVFGFGHSGNVTTIEIGARAGFNLNITEHIGIWPMAGISVTHISDSSMAGTSSTPATLTIFAPFLYHIVPHLFVGAGPSVFVALNGHNDNAFGIDSIIGGWF